MRNILIFLFVMVYVQLIARENFVFSPINSSNGLSDNRIRSICQLPDGRMIFITPGLVNIYDGSNFQYMHFNDQKAYPIKSYSGWHHAYVDDENHVWIKNQYKLMIFDICNEIFIANADSVFSTQGINENISDFFIDSHHNFWYLTDKHELYYRKSGDISAKLFIANAIMPDGNCKNLYDIAVYNEQVFLFYKSGLTICYNLRSSQELYRENLSAQNIFEYTNTLMVVPYGKYLYQVRNGKKGGLLLRFDVTNHKWEKALATDYYQNTLTIDKKGNCWLSSYAGIWLIDSTLQNKQLISPLHLVDGKVFESEISSQYNDKSGGLWIGTVDRGLLYYHPDRFKFRNFGRTFFNVTNNKSIRVTSLAESNGEVFIGTQNGLYTYEKNAQSLILHDKTPYNIQCNNILKDSRHRLWLCSENNGLFCFDGNKVNHYSFPFNIQYLFERYDSVFCLCSNSIFGTFSPDSGNFHRIESAGRDRVGEIFQLVKYNQDSLLGTSDNGPFFFNCRKNIFEPFSGSNLLEHNNHQISCILVDSRGIIWFGTQDGLGVYIPSTGSYHSIYEENGLVNNSIRSIIEDKSGKIWVSTSNGISCITLALIGQDHQFSFANFNQYDGVIENEFLLGSVVKTEDNRILWGGIDGFNEIDLSWLDSSKQIMLTPVFTNFYLSGNEIKVGKEYNGQLILKHSISSTQTIRLKYFQNFIGIEFSALNYVNPTQTYYQYKLEGVDANWNEISSKDGIGRINYTNLSPGTYRLGVYAANNSRQWGKQPAGLTIVISPPFWKTSLAYFFYIILFLGAMSFVFYFSIQWNRKKMLKRQQEELEQVKQAFYTNISHELKTPLTMILSPLGAIIRKYGNDPLKPRLSEIYSHAKDLLNLVNQLLDFRKIEMNGEALQLNYCQIDEFLGPIVQSFHETAHEKKIKLTFHVQAKNLYAHVDKNKMQKIVYNLLSNALKFTPKGGEVSLTVSMGKPENQDNPKIVIQVSDTGCGIPEKEFLQIFERFYQARQNDHPGGSGIGLYLVKQYVQMHNGLVKVESRLNEGSTFTVEIPGQQHSPEENQIRTEKKVSQSSVKVLVVEDNVKFQSFLFNELSEYYQVITASNGKEGLKKAREQQPGLIITDVMMPEMSGTDLCHEIKNDLKVSHIPVIMLTAKSSEQAQVEGFMAGADAYVTKPFNLNILLVRIQNLIEQQEQRKKLFKNIIEVNPGTITLTNIDEKLIKTALEHIEKNMGNEQYSVEQLSKDMFMDRTNLYRKLMAIVGQTPIEFIRSVRLKRAARLLESGLSVNEVSERVGFGTTSYFSKCFQKEFGVKPSHYKSVKDTNEK